MLNLWDSKIWWLIIDATEDTLLLLTILTYPIVALKVVIHNFDTIISERPILDPISLLARADLSCLEKVGVEHITSRSFILWFISYNLVEGNRYVLLFSRRKIRSHIVLQLDFSRFLSVNISFNPKIWFILWLWSLKLFSQYLIALLRLNRIPKRRLCLLKIQDLAFLFLIKLTIVPRLVNGRADHIFVQRWLFLWCYQFRI